MIASSGPESSGTDHLQHVEDALVVTGSLDAEEHADKRAIELLCRVVGEPSDREIGAERQNLASGLRPTRRLSLRRWLTRRTQSVRTSCEICPMASAQYPKPAKASVIDTPL